ncbi:translation initiation factor eIF5A [Xanthoria calcicola]
MSSIQDHDFSSTSADASLTTPTQASTLAKGDHILIQNQPCKISSKSTSKPGKHGHAKISFEALSLLTHKKHTDLCPAHHFLHVPTVTRKDYLVIDLTSDGFLSLFDIHNPEVTKDDIKAPGGETEVGERLRRLWGKVGAVEGDGEVWVGVLGVMGWEIVEGVREWGRE